MRPSFITLSWFKFMRSTNRNNSIAVKLILIFFALYLSVVAFSLSFQVEKLIAQKFPNEPLMFVFNKLVLAYMTTMLFLRISIQSLPTMGIQPFLLMPIKKTRLARYMLGKSFFHFFNLLPFFLLIPFTFHSVVKYYAHSQIIVWWTVLVCLIVINHLLAIYLKWRTIKNEMLFYILMVFFLLLFVLEYFKVLVISDMFSVFVKSVLANNWLLVVFVLTIAGLLLLNYRYLLQNFYLANFTPKTSDRKRLLTFDWTSKLTKHSELLSLELKMIFRNKRSRNTVFFSLIFLAYGFLYYKPNKEIETTMMFFLGIFITGLSMINYGQFFPAWQGRNYSFLMVQNFRFRDYLNSIYRLMFIATAILLMLSLGFMFIDIKIGYVHLVSAVYNVGVNIYIIFSFGLKTRKSIELSNGSMFNYQGVSASHFLMVFPLMFLPLIIFGILNYLLGANVTLILFATVGFIGILLHKTMLKYFEKKYLIEKYRMLEGYKKS